MQVSSLSDTTTPSSALCPPTLRQSQQFQNMAKFHLRAHSWALHWLPVTALDLTRNENKIHPGRWFCGIELFFLSQNYQSQRNFHSLLLLKGQGDQVENIQVYQDLPSLSILSTSFSQVLCLDKENSTKSAKGFEFLRQKKSGRAKY